MQRHRSAVVLMIVLSGAAAACRNASAPEAPLPADWRVLARNPASFAALYRLSCCGQRNLVLAVRSGAGRMSLSVAVPPGGTTVSAWFAGDRGWIRRVKERCRQPLSPGVIPLSKDAALPLDPSMAAHVLSGSLPEDAHEVPMAPGWVEASDERFTWSARIEGTPTRCARILVLRHGEGRPILGAELKSPVGPVPGELVLTAGSQRAELVLEEWHWAEAPQPPGWLDLPECGAAQ